MIKIYLVGNALLQDDSMPFRIKSFLEKAFPSARFLEFDPTENFPDDAISPIFIDTVVNIPHARIFTSLNAFFLFQRGISVHSFDFFTELALLKKIGLYKDYTIIGVPLQGAIEIIAKETVAIINELFTSPPI